MYPLIMLLYYTVTESLMDLIAMALILVLLLKLISIANAIRWLKVQGSTYVFEFNRRGQQNYEELDHLFDNMKCDFFPFGFKDYKLRLYLQNRINNPLKFNLILSCASLFQSLLYRFERLTIITALYLFVAVPFARINLLHVVLDNRWTCIMLIILAFFLLLGNLMLSIEAVYSYGIIGSYAVSFHMLSPVKEKWAGGSSFLLELRVLVSKLMTTLIAGATAFYVARGLYGALDGDLVAFDPLLPLSWVQTYFQCSYFALTTLLTIGYGDIRPATIFGQVTTFLFQIQGFALVGIVAGSLFSSRESQGPPSIQNGSL